MKIKCADGIFPKNEEEAATDAFAHSLMIKEANKKGIRKRIQVKESNE